MSFEPVLLPTIIEALSAIIAQNAEEVTALDQVLGDGDHVTNVQRGLAALMTQREALSDLAWPVAWQQIGMSLMSAVGGASGLLYSTFFLSLAKAGQGQDLTLNSFAECFAQAVDALKKRGKSEAGEKTLLDVFVPVSVYLTSAAERALPVAVVLTEVAEVAIAGMESTRDMLATKGRASFLEARSLGHIDAGAKTAQLMICALVEVLKKLNNPSVNERYERVHPTAL